MKHYSTNYDFQGKRRRKTKARNPYPKMTQPPFKPLRGDMYMHRSVDQHKSAPDTLAACPKHDDQYKKQVSSQYTIAPAYNKGAYQVVSNDNVKDIGR